MHCANIEMLSFCYLWCLWNWENMRLNRIQRITAWLLNVMVSLYDERFLAFSGGIWIALSTARPRSSVSISQMLSTSKSPLLFRWKSGKSAQKSRKLWDPWSAIPLLLCSGCLFCSFLFHFDAFFFLEHKGSSSKHCIWCLCRLVCLLSLYLSLQSASSAFNVQHLFLLPCVKMIWIFLWLWLEAFLIQLLIGFCLWQLL